METTTHERECTSTKGKCVHMVTIKVFGTTPPCARCRRAEQEAQKAAQEFPGQVKVQKLDALGPEADDYGMMLTPTVLVDDKVIAAGRIVPADQLVALIKRALGG
jgi:hypothetical protein